MNSRSQVSLFVLCAVFVATFPCRSVAQPGISTDKPNKKKKKDGGDTPASSDRVDEKAARVRAMMAVRYEGISPEARGKIEEALARSLGSIGLRATPAPIEPPPSLGGAAAHVEFARAHKGKVHYIVDGLIYRQEARGGNPAAWGADLSMWDVDAERFIAELKRQETTSLEDLIRQEEERCSGVLAILFADTLCTEARAVVRIRLKDAADGTLILDDHDTSKLPFKRVLTGKHEFLIAAPGVLPLHFFATVTRSMNIELKTVNVRVIAKPVAGEEKGDAPPPLPDESVTFELDGLPQAEGTELSVKMMAEESDFLSHGELNHTAKAVPGAGPSGCLIHEPGSRTFTIKDNTELDVPLRPTDARYAISTTPSGLFKLYADGKAEPDPANAGTALEGQVKAGYHRFKVAPSAAMKCKQTDWVLVCGGGVFQHDFELHKVSRPLLYAGIPVLIGGAALLGAGIYGFAVDGQEVSCDKAPGQTACPQVRDTLTSGLAYGITGLVLAGVGAALIIVDHLKLSHQQTACEPESVEPHRPSPAMSPAPPSPAPIKEN